MRVTETAMAATARCGDGPQKLSCLAADDITNNPILAAEQAAVARLRLQYLARRLHALGQKPLFYFLRQVEAGTDLRSHLEVYAALTRDFIVALGGDQFAAAFDMNDGGCD
jgi:hypothetical protein